MFLFLCFWAFSPLFWGFSGTAVGGFCLFVLGFIVVGAWCVGGFDWFVGYGLVVGIGGLWLFVQVVGFGVIVGCSLGFWCVGVGFGFGLFVVWVVVVWVVVVWVVVVL